MKKKKSIAKLQAEVRSKYFNKFIRLRDAVGGYVTCVTCGKRIHWKEANAGHFQHGLDFIEDNQHVQCVGCNLYNSGKLDAYTIFMIDKYGRERVDELIRLKRTLSYSRAEIEEIAEKYKPIVKRLEVTNGI